ncbi:hypothetical protein HDK64DRAFT_86912 [Phyllosticta capitalensis]
MEGRATDFDRRDLEVLNRAIESSISVYLGFMIIVPLVMPTHSFARCNLLPSQTLPPFPPESSLSKICLSATNNTLTPNSHPTIRQSPSPIPLSHVQQNHPLNLGKLKPFFFFFFVSNQQPTNQRTSARVTASVPWWRSEGNRDETATLSLLRLRCGVARGRGGSDGGASLRRGRGRDGKRGGEGGEDREGVGSDG